MIKLKKIQLRNYMSYKEVELNLDTNESYIVIGENKDNPLTESNGSGKSSIFEAIIFAIYGKSIRGKNIDFQRNGNCLVRLIAEVDNKEVIIERYYKHQKYKNKVRLFVNGTDQTAHTIKATQEQIEKLFRISFDHFISSVVITQGFQIKITTMKPSQFRTYFSDLIGYDYDRIINSCKAKIKELETKITELSNNIREIENKISAIEAKLELQGYGIDFVNPDEIESTLDQLKSEHSSIISRLNEIQPQVANYNTLLDRYNNLKSKWIKIKQNPNVCPTCGRPFDTTDLLAETEHEMIKLKSEIMGLVKLASEHEQLLQQKHILESKIQVLEDEYSKALQAKKLREAEYSKLESELMKLRNKLRQHNEEYSQSIELYDKYKRLLSLFQPSGEIREKVVSHYIRIYSQIVKNIALAVGEKILQNNDITNIDYLGLSGGERRRLDIILHLALVDFISCFSGINFNILVLDEIFENLDFKSMVNFAEFIKSYFSNKTLFIISHNEALKDYFQNKIIVVKQSGVSTITIHQH